MLKIFHKLLFKRSRNGYLLNLIKFKHWSINITLVFPYYIFCMYDKTVSLKFDRQGASCWHNRSLRCPVNRPDYFTAIMCREGRIPLWNTKLDHEQYSCLVVFYSLSEFKGVVSLTIRTAQFWLWFFLNVTINQHFTKI